MTIKFVSPLLVAATCSVSAFGQSATQVIPTVSSVHTHSIESIKWSSDNRFLVTASGDHTAKLWDAASARMLRTLTGHKDWVHDATFSPDGKLVVTGSSDDTAIIWDAATGSMLHHLTGHENDVRIARFSPDGQYVVTASFDGTAKIWNPSTGELINTMSGHSNIIRSIAFSANSKMVATGSQDQTAKVWDMATGKLLFTISGFNALVSSISFNKDCKEVAASSADGTVRICNTATGKPIRVLRDFAGRVNSVNYSPDGTSMIIGDDKSVTTWSASTAKAIKKIDVNGMAGEATFSSDGSRILVVLTTSYGSADGVKLLDNSGKKVFEQKELNAAGFSGDGKLAIAGYRFLKTLDAADGNVISFFTGKMQEIKRSQFSPNGRYLSISGEHRFDLILDMNTGKVPQLQGGADSLDEVRFLGDNIIATGSTKLYDLSNGKLLFSKKDCYFDEIDPKHKSGVVYTDRGIFTVFSLDTGTILQRIGHSIDRAAYDVNGKYLLTTRLNSVKLWDAATGRFLRSIDNLERLKVAAFNPDGSRIYTISSDSILQIWEPSSGKQITRTVVGKIGQQALMFNKTGTLFASGHTNTPQVSVVDALSGHVLKTLTIDSAGVGSVFFADKDKFMSVIENAGNYKTWDTGSWQLVNEGKAREVERGTIKTSPDGKTIFDPSSGTFMMVPGNKPLEGIVDDINTDWTLTTQTGIGQVIIGSFANRRNLLELTIIDNSDWLLTDTEGHFDASSGGEARIYFVKGMEIVERSGAQRTTDLWKKTLSGGTTR